MKQFLLALSLMIATASAAYAGDEVYCNGQRKVYAGDLLWPNGKRVVYAGDHLYPNGKRVKYAGDLLYPNGGRMVYAGDQLYANGGRVKYAGDLLYPNKQRVVYAGDCYFQNGTRMGSCPSQVRYVERVENFRIEGVLDLNSKEAINQSFELRDGNMTVYFDVSDNGEISNIDAFCE
jgi:hypothetical protein